MPKGKRGRPVDPSLPARRRDQILAVAARLFARHGYNDLDLGTLAARVGIGKGTVYRYFPDKRSLFRQTVMREMERVGAAAHAAVSADGSVNDKLLYFRQRMVAFMRALGKEPHVIELLVIERAEARHGGGRPSYFAYRDGTLPQWRALLRSLKTRGRLRATDVDLIATAITAFAYGAILSYPFLDRGRSLGADAERLVDLLLTGVCR
jgi:AcrR family transcriptional regulator